MNESDEGGERKRKGGCQRRRKKLRKDGRSNEREREGWVWGKRKDL